MGSAAAPDIGRPWWNLFAELPLVFQILFWIVLAITISSAISVTLLLISAARFRRRADKLERRGASTADDFLWVFLVPALNEEVTIADSVARLREVDAKHRVILAINDGSEDRTGAILESLAGPDLEVLTRVLPEARKGKAAGLNAAYHYVRDTVIPERYPQFTHDHVIIGVVDADGRLAADAPVHVAPHFADPRMGGAQVLVRIYNRGRFLTWAQDVEFSAFGFVFQAGRAGWGTANMGGNGQFNRLSALDTVANDEGPWRHKLTEDQDLGVRLIQRGWRGTQVNKTQIEQQGVSDIRRLYKQRTRWAQGSWQALALLPGVIRTRSISPIAWIDAVYYLLTPILQLLTGVGFICAVALAIITGVPIVPGNWVLIVFFATLGFGPGLAVLLLRANGIGEVLKAILVVVPYTVYSWMIFPVLGRSLVRQISGRTSWAKTAREPLAADATAAETAG